MRIIAALLSTCLVALLAIRPLPGQSLDMRDIGTPTFTSFTTRNGLPNAAITALATDHDGYTWAATATGLFRYDGTRWSAVDDVPQNAPVTTLWADHAGTLWLALGEHGVARHDADGWHHDAAATMPRKVRRFAETRDANGDFTLWALTTGQGLWSRQADRWQADAGNASLGDAMPRAFAQTQTLGGRPQQWLGETNGLWHRDAGTSDWQRWPVGEFTGLDIHALQVVRRGDRDELWMSAFGNGLFHFDDQGSHHWVAGRNGLPSGTLLDLAATDLGSATPTLWAASRSGLIRIRGDRAQLFDRGDGLPSSVVRSLSLWRSPAGSEVLWLATESGAARSMPTASPWTTVSQLGAGATGVFAVLLQPTAHGERLWVGAADAGLALYEEDRWREFSHANGALPYTNVTQIVPALGGGLWIANGPYLLREHDGADGPRLTTVATPLRQTTGTGIMSLLERHIDGHEELWLGTYLDGLYLRRDGHWQAVPIAGLEAPGPKGITALLEQTLADGRRWLWAGTRHGVARHDGQHWQLLDAAAGVPDVAVMGLTLLADAQGEPVLWVATDSAGMLRLAVGDPAQPRRLPDDLPPPPDPRVYGALADSVGRVYLCTDRGVQQLTPTGSGWRSRVFTRADGMVHDECNGGAQLIDAQDRYWTGTLGGLTVYDPRADIADRESKPLRITAVHVDGTRVAAGDVHVPPGNHRIEVEYSLLSWLREDESRYRSQLLGHESTPGPWTAQASRELSALPPGRYTLRLEARDHAGNRSDPLDLPLTIDAAWWQEDWTRLAGILALLLLGYGLAQWRVRQLRAQREELEQRVAQRTAELDAANTRLLELSYRDELTGLANRRHLLERMDALLHDDSTCDTVALIFIDVDHFKQFNDSHGHLAGDAALRAIGAILRDDTPPGAVAARYGGEEFACLLPDAGCGEAGAFAERLRLAIAARDIVIDGSGNTRRVTISAGVACTHRIGAADTQHLLREADGALYQAKRDGRNRVQLWHDGTRGAPACEITAAADPP